MTIGPDIGSADPILSIGAIGVLILNSTGVAGDFTVNLGINLDILEVDVYARVIFNSSGGDMTLRLPDELYDYLNELGADTLAGVANPGELATDLLARLVACPGGPANELRCYTISGRSPNLVSGTGPDVVTINWLLGDGPAPDLSAQPSEAYIVAVVDGDLTLLGFASASVFGAIRISESEFELIADLTFQLGPNPAVSLMVDVSAIAEISSAGFYLNASVDIEANLLSVFDLDVSGTVTIDTRGLEPVLRARPLGLGLDPEGGLAQRQPRDQGRRRARRGRLVHRREPLGPLRTARTERERLHRLVGQLLASP